MAACNDCGLKYDSKEWADVVVPNDVWQRINPLGHDVLCFNCMVGRLTDLGLRNVPYSITSGPFAFSIREAAEAAGGK